MTCEIRVSISNDHSRDESVFSFNDGSPDKAGALVAIVARKAAEGEICNDRYDVFDNILDWFDESCPNWELLPDPGSVYEIVYYYHIKLSNDREGNLEIEIGFSQRGLPVRYVTVNDWIKEVNRVRRGMNHIFQNCNFNNVLPIFPDFKPAKMLRKVKKN